MFRKVIVGVAAVICLGWPALAADIHNDASATSSANVSISSKGVVTMHSRNATLVPYAVFDGTRHFARIATITADVTRRTDAEGDDPASKITVAVDDMSAESPKRLASFSDPGSEWAMLGESYFDIRQPGCCAGPTVHAVRELESGKLLYSATGDAEGGSAAWAVAPNAGPRMVRWAAFDGRTDEKAAGEGVLGLLAYGGLEGARSHLVVKGAKPLDLEDLSLGLSHGAKLVWVDAKSQKSGHPPAGGTAADPENIWSLDGVKSSESIGGFSLRLIDFNGHPLATIPISSDRLDITNAKLAPGISLVENPG